jgi:DNA-binding response OmpR family regulator
MKSILSSTTTFPHAVSRSRCGEPNLHHEGIAAPSPGTSSPGRRILLVDDDRTVRDSLNDVLVGEGYCVIPAKNGQEAIELASKSPVDLALLDLNMPVKNGWDTFEQLTRDYPSMPIVIVTARPNQLFTALSAGVGALLEKPMDIQTLLQTIKQLLSESAGQHLARLAGTNTELYYRPATASQESTRAAKHH